jgi:RNA polymerase sigma factor (sigma-70 family)
MQKAIVYSDAELLQDLRREAHTDRALRFIYREYYRMLEQVVLQNSGNQADAEDVIQEVLLVFVDMVRQGRYQGKASVRSFLYTLTRNKWISEIRKKNSSDRRHQYFENERETTEADVSELLGYHESLRLVQTLFEKLGKSCQKILTLFYYDDLPMKDILQHTSFENEQVLRNKKYKCLKTLINRVHQSPVIFDQLKQALRHGK